jgi:tetratricopeptide (TPR) repeat protein
MLRRRTFALAGASEGRGVQGRPESSFLTTVPILGVVGSPQLDVLALAQHHLSTGRPAKALEELDAGGGDAYGDADYWRISASALHSLERPEQALGAALQGLTLQPSSVGLLDIKALSELALGDAVAAERTLRGALTLEPSNEYLLAHRALALAVAGQTAEARLAVDEVLTIAPGSLLALRTRAQVAQVTGDANLERYAADLLAADPEGSLGYRLQASVAHARRDVIGMDAAYREAAALNPDNERLAKSARSARVHTHSALTPNRALLALRAGRYRFLFIALSLGLFIAGHQTFALVVVLANLALWGYIRVTYRLIRRAEAKKYGDV